MAQMLQSVSQAEFGGWIGAAREDITPPVGIYSRNWGAASHDTDLGVHRPLTATALTLQTAPEAAPCVLVALDLCWWRAPEDEGKIRNGLIAALSLDPARVLINLSHTHAAPLPCLADSDKPGGHLMAPWLETLQAAVITAARRALAGRRPATLSWRYGRCDLAQDRDLYDPAADLCVVGYNPALVADDTLLVGRVTTEDGAILATLVNYACHATTLGWENRQTSPDFIGAMREVVEAQTGSAPCLFLQGASGELAPLEQYRPDTAVADRNGRRLGFAALAALEGMLPSQTRLDYTGVVESGAPLAIWQRAPQAASRTLQALQTVAEVPLRPFPTSAEIEARLAACADRVIAERLLRDLYVRQWVGDEAQGRIPVWAWQVGEAVLIGEPNEAYSWLQTELRRAFPERPVVVMNIANGSCGYLPRAECYDREGYFYTVAQTPYGRGALEALAETCSETVRRLLAASP